VVCPHYGPPWNEGVKNMVRVLKERISSSGTDVVVCSPEDGDRQGYLAHLPLPSIIKNKILFWLRTARRARREQVKVIHLFSSLSSILGIKCFIIKSFSKLPLVLHVTGLGTPVFGYRFLLKAEQIIVGGSYLMKFFPTALDLPPVSPHVNNRNGKEDNKLEAKPHHGKILYLGALERVRGVHTLVDAVAALKTHFDLQDFTVTIAWNGYGDREYAQSVKEKIKEYEIEEHFKWERSIEDVPTLYRNNDIVVIPRAFQQRMGFPLRLLEAMSFGKPVVVSDLGEMAQAAEGCGLVFPHGNSERLATALHKLLTNDLFYQQCAHNAYQRVSRYSAQSTVARLLDVYRQVAMYDS